MSITSLVSILLAAILTNNLFYQNFSEYVRSGVSKKLDTAVGMSAAVIFVMLHSHGSNMAHTDISADPKRSGLSADHRVYSCHSSACSVCGNHFKEVHGKSLSGVGRLFAFDHNKLRRTWCNHSEY